MTQTKTIDYTGISGSRIAYYAARESAQYHKTLIVVSSEAAAERLREDLDFFAQKKVITAPQESDFRIIYEAKDKDYLSRRIRAQLALSDSEDAIVVVPASALIKPIPPREHFLSRIISLSVGDVIDPAELKRNLVRAGYEASVVTESCGEFSSRGGIIDVFPVTEGDPVRIEFFDDEIDSIRTYDSVTQRSLENLSEVTIAPAALFIPEEAEIEAAADKTEAAGETQLAELMRERVSAQLYAENILNFDVEICSIWDYMDDGLTIFADPVMIDKSVDEDYPRQELYRFYQGDTVFFTPFAGRIEGVDSLTDLINVMSRDVAPFNGQMKLLVKEIESMLADGYALHFVSGSLERSERIKDYLDDSGLLGQVTYEVGSLVAGMIIPDEKVCYITERDVFPSSRKKLFKRKKRSGGIEFSDLQKGDYVVHEIYGIGRFQGIKTLTADGVTGDYLEIRYAGTDVLSIPMSQIDIIQRYIGNKGRAPRLSSLNGSGWRRARERARRAVMEIAADLVKLYAEREAGSGYAFSPDTVWQNEFEEEFPYTETDDQIRATEEIKADMEQPLPMDRLLCGDVGYGKTEVAARAIFKCISEGKQAVLLAPTTLLVNQHYNTLKERFANFPFEVEMLSRFKSDSEQADIVQRLARGQIDLIIGTHRLLSPEVKYKNLGLLVIDEEQRFGVKHKERIKMVRKDVDVLTLSATPIPRTLNMSLTGIKNISMIEEPPDGRFPVQTYVAPEDENLIKSVIEREMARGGQVFVTVNRVRGINAIADQIRELVPRATVAVGHGQMHESALENVMIDFVAGKVDVLVATTIIENGIDIPNANTMIVLNADMLGLSQLYQLRGRVGRSDRIAYAYLLYTPQKVMSELAQKRLAAIRDFTEFGAGFKLAMRDLELRGAGNILGEAQHGHIDGIGYELYCKEVNRAVKELRGEKVADPDIEATIEVNIPARIPDEYISNETLKLQAYKKIAQIDSKQATDDVINELIDRFGDIPELTMNLIKVSEIKSHAEKLGIELIQGRGERIILSPGAKSELDAFVLVMSKDVIGDKLTILGGDKVSLSLFVGKDDIVDKLLDLMRVLNDCVASRENAS